MPKGTSLDKATSSNERIKLVALAVIELRLSESISQSFSRSVCQEKIPLKKFFFNFMTTFGNISGRTKGTLDLVNTAKALVLG